MRLRGLRDIKTHGSLAREEKLISVARDLHRSGSRKNEGTISDDWSVERHIYKKKRPANTATVIPLRHELYLERKVRSHQIEITEDLFAEFQQAIVDGLPVAMHEFERLKTRLAELQTG